MFVAFRETEEPLLLSLLSYMHTRFLLLPFLRTEEGTDLERRKASTSISFFLHTYLSPWREERNVDTYEEWQPLTRVFVSTLSKNGTRNRDLERGKASVSTSFFLHTYLSLWREERNVDTFEEWQPHTHILHLLRLGKEGGRQGGIKPPSATI